jgi:hypothetical protein
MKTKICCVKCFHLQITTLKSWKVVVEEQMHTPDRDGIYQTNWKLTLAMKELLQIKAASYGIL